MEHQWHTWLLPSIPLLFLPHFDAICDQLLNRCAATKSLFLINEERWEILSLVPNERWKVNWSTWHERWAKKKSESPTGKTHGRPEDQAAILYPLSYETSWRARSFNEASSILWLLGWWSTAEVIVSKWITRWWIFSSAMKCESWIDQQDMGLRQRKIWVPDRYWTHDLQNTRQVLYPLS